MKRFIPWSALGLAASLGTGTPLFAAGVDDILIVDDPLPASAPQKKRVPTAASTASTNRSLGKSSQLKSAHIPDSQPKAVRIDGTDSSSQTFSQSPEFDSRGTGGDTGVDFLVGPSRHLLENPGQLLVCPPVPETDALRY